LRRRKQLEVQAHRAKETRQSGTNGCIIVDDEDYGSLFYPLFPHAAADGPSPLAQSRRLRGLPVNNAWRTMLLAIVTLARRLAPSHFRNT